MTKDKVTFSSSPSESPISYPPLVIETARKKSLLPSCFRFPPPPFSLSLFTNVSWGGSEKEGKEGGDERERFRPPLVGLSACRPQLRTFFSLAPSDYYNGPLVDCWATWRRRLSPQEAEKEKDDLPSRPKALVELGEAVGRTLLVQCSVKRKGRKIPPPNKKKVYFRSNNFRGPTV